ncbi:MAG TPA: DNA replication and repair protein RecF [Thermoanaerobaculia bacterium]|nr:DNA replication and repair protein RecF [Thermoanaerobaculia bacterium]
MILRSIATQAFRNLASEEVAFHEHVNIVVGRNGQGKTNLLEAIYFLATTKSFRTSRVASLFAFGSPSTFVSGQMHRFGVDKTLSVGLETGETRRRALLINGERVPLAVYVNAMSVFAYSSARLDILRGAPEERRRFLDRGIASIDPGYLEAVSRYGRVLRQRNALLASGSASSLAAWDAELIASAAPLQRGRAAYTEALASSFAAIVAEHGYHIHNLAIAYKPSSVDDLARIRRDELRARMSLVGPQRDVLEFSVNGRPAAEVLSGGEQKMVVLFLKFAKLDLFRRRFDEPAVFLLDDVDAELDLEILEQLLVKLPSRTQVFATSAKERFLRTLEAGPHRRLVIENGRVAATNDLP